MRSHLTRCTGTHLNRTPRNVPCLAVVFIILLGGLCLQAAELEEFKGVTYIPHVYNDGDSFRVKIGDKEYCPRLYFVDCPEAVATSKGDMGHVREQMRYFGLEKASSVTAVGLNAKRYVARILSGPFTVHTSFASAGGRSAGGRIYAFVTTSEGKDLARLLVAKGYARTKGIGRKTPQGDSRDDTVARLKDLEVAAAMKKVGIWEKSDPDCIVKMREEQRVEDKELEALKKEVEAAGRIINKIDINKASKAWLKSVNGIGPVLAQRIIDGRPYESVDDLLKVRGIGPKSLEKMRPYLE